VVEVAYGVAALAVRRSSAGNGRAEGEPRQIPVEPAAHPGQHPCAYRLEDGLDAEQNATSTTSAASVGVLRLGSTRS